MIIISVLGYSGSGKTYFILNVIDLLKKEKNYHCAVIKNIHEHQIDKEGKDSFLFCKQGAEYAITKNIYNETTIFIKQELNLPALIEWVESGPFKVDVIFIEGFRNVNYPTLLCIKTISEIEPQLNKNVLALSGIFLQTNSAMKNQMTLPVIDLKENFQDFLNVFNIL